MAARVLVVDDDDGVRMVLADIIEAQGHNVETADTAEEALNLLAVHSYDVILSDYYMTGMNGDEFYRQIDQRWPHLAPRVVFVTGDERSIRTQRTGADVPIITKPFTFGQIRDVIAAVSAPHG